MKKTLKRALTALIAAALLLSCLPLGTLADTESEYDRLWEERSEKVYLWEKAMMGRGEYSVSGEPFFSDFAFLILYAEAAQELTFVRLSEFDPDFDPSFSWGYAGNVLLWLERGDALLSPQLEALTQNCYNEDKTREATPSMHLLVRELGIEKKELKAAYQKMKDDPRSIRSLLPMLSDEEFEEILKGNRCFKESYEIPDFFFEALYLEDENQVKSLLARPYTVVLDGEALTAYDLFVTAKYSFEELAEKGVLTKEFRYFMDQVEKESEEGTSISVKDCALFEELEAYLAENPENDPPETGDSTAAYALIFTLAALPLAGFGVYEWKRRRRTV